jgi:plasmid maintenance system antidote protein VapI
MAELFQATGPNINIHLNSSCERGAQARKAFGVSMDLLLNMQLAYDAAQTRAHARDINERRFHAVPVP